MKTIILLILSVLGIFLFGGFMYKIWSSTYEDRQNKQNELNKEFDQEANDRMNDEIFKDLL